jgi:DNA polymerase-3 subunit alpha
VRTTDVAERPAGSEVVLAGLVLGLSETVVKTGNSAGRKMARFRLEDLSGSVAVVCFPRAYETSRQHVVDNALVVIRAKVEERGDEPGLVLEEAMDVESALARFSGGVVIQLGPEDDVRLPDLHATLQNHRGKSPLYFLVTGQDGCTRTVRAGPGHGLVISAGLAADVDRLLGRGRVRLARL